MNRRNIYSSPENPSRIATLIKLYNKGMLTEQELITQKKKILMQHYKKGQETKPTTQQGTLKLQGPLKFWTGWNK